MERKVGERNFTTASGIPVAEKQNSLTLALRGPLNRRRLPQRVVPAKKVGAPGVILKLPTP